MRSLDKEVKELAAKVHSTAPLAAAKLLMEHPRAEPATEDALAVAITAAQAAVYAQTLQPAENVETKDDPTDSTDTDHAAEDAEVTKYVQELLREMSPEERQQIQDIIATISRKQRGSAAGRNDGARATGAGKDGRGAKWDLGGLKKQSRCTVARHQPMQGRTRRPSAARVVGDCWCTLGQAHTPECPHN